jgi:surface-adhesin protein E
MRAPQQFDCKEERMRVLDQTYFDGNMANGNVVYSDSTEGSWEPVAPETNGKFLWKTACGHVHSPLIPGNLP